MRKDLGSAVSSVDKYLRSVTGPKGFPALGGAITDRQGLLLNSAYGYECLESRKEATTKTLFQIGSVSKSFASVTLLQLFDEGKVDLHCPVTEYLPWLEFKTRYEPISLHHLLTHTAGIVQGSEETMNAKPEAFWLRYLPTSVPPGTFFHYSNTGYKIIGLVIETLCRKPFYKVLQERVVEPLGMSSTLTSISNEFRPFIATAYLPVRDDRPAAYGAPLAPAPWFESDPADGSICSTGSDMARYMRFILNKGKIGSRRLISEKAFALLTKKAVASKDGKHDEYYGYGLDVAEDSGHLEIRHTGGMVGQYCSMRIDMDDGIGAMVMVNGPGSPDEVCKNVQKTLRARIAGDAHVPALKPGNPFLVENAGRYAGVYSSAVGSIRVSPLGNGLKLTPRSGRTVKLQVMGADTFYGDTEGFTLFPIRFISEDGKYVHAVHGGTVYRRRGIRTEAAKKQAPNLRPYTGHYRSYNPWVGSFRIVDREGTLLLIYSSGQERELVRVGKNEFRVGKDRREPERIVFDMSVDGQYQRAVFSGGSHYRTFVP